MGSSRGGCLGGMGENDGLRLCDGRWDGRRHESRVDHVHNLGIEKSKREAGICAWLASSARPILSYSTVSYGMYFMLVGYAHIIILLSDPRSTYLRPASAPIRHDRHFSRSSSSQTIYSRALAPATVSQPPFPLARCTTGRISREDQQEKSN
jgi:hypothetical protein